MENKGLNKLSLSKLQRAGENSLHGMDRANSRNTNSPIKESQQSLLISCSSNKFPKKNNTLDRRILENNECLITSSVYKSTNEQLKESPRFGCSKDAKKDTQQQSCNIKIPISTSIKLISDMKVEKSNDSFDLSLINTDFNIAQHDRKKKEFVKNQKEWDIEKNAIKKSLKIETTISSEQNITDSMNIHDRVSRLNMLYYNRSKTQD